LPELVQFPVKQASTPVQKRPSEHAPPSLAGVRWQLPLTGWHVPMLQASFKLEQLRGVPAQTPLEQTSASVQGSPSEQGAVLAM
jgi:hypothetical protein